MFKILPHFSCNLALTRLAAPPVQMEDTGEKIVKIPTHAVGTVTWDKQMKSVFCQSLLS